MSIDVFKYFSNIHVHRTRVYKIFFKYIAPEYSSTNMTWMYRASKIFLKDIALDRCSNIYCIQTLIKYNVPECCRNILKCRWNILSLKYSSNTLYTRTYELRCSNVVQPCFIQILSRSITIYQTFRSITRTSLKPGVPWQKYSNRESSSCTSWGFHEFSTSSSPTSRYFGMSLWRSRILLRGRGILNSKGRSIDCWPARTSRVSWR